MAHHLNNGRVSPSCTNSKGLQNKLVAHTRGYLCFASFLLSCAGKVQNLGGKNLKKMLGQCCWGQYGKFN